MQNRFDSTNLKNIVLRDFIRSQQLHQSGGQNILFPVDTRKVAGYSSTCDQVSKNTQTSGGNSQLYLLDAAASGNYNLRMATDNATGNSATYEFTMNNQNKLSFILPSRQVAGIDTVGIGLFYLNKGRNGLRVNYKNNAYPNYALLFEKTSTANSEGVHSDQFPSDQAYKSRNRDTFTTQ